VPVLVNSVVDRLLAQHASYDDAGIWVLADSELRQQMCATERDILLATIAQRRDIDRRIDKLLEVWPNESSKVISQRIAGATEERVERRRLGRAA